jgi:hypothetical protein
MALETDYVIELLLDEARLEHDERDWLRSLRGAWLTSAQRKRLTELHERRMPRGRHGPMEAM